jgi:hypothetical protein
MQLKNHPLLLISGTLLIFFYITIYLLFTNKSRMKSNHQYRFSQPPPRHFYVTVVDRLHFKMVSLPSLLFFSFHPFNSIFTLSRSPTGHVGPFIRSCCPPPCPTHCGLLHFSRSTRRRLLRRLQPPLHFSCLSGTWQYLNY